MKISPSTEWRSVWEGFYKFPDWPLFFPQQKTQPFGWVSFPKPAFARKLSPSGLPVMTSKVFDPFGLLISFAGSENPYFFFLFIT
jgi:hypothetical protein